MSFNAKLNRVGKDFDMKRIFLLLLFAIVFSVTEAQ
jgi:hypothetical protein